MQGNIEKKKLGWRLYMEYFYSTYMELKWNICWKIKLFIINIVLFLRFPGTCWAAVVVYIQHIIFRSKITDSDKNFPFEIASWWRIYFIFKFTGTFNLFQNLFPSLLRRFVLVLSNLVRRVPLLKFAGVLYCVLCLRTLS